MSDTQKGVESSAVPQGGQGVGCASPMAALTALRPSAFG